MRLLFIGFGVVGQGLTRLLQQGAQSLRDSFGFEPTITGVATGSHGTLAHPAGLDKNALLQAAAAGDMAHYPRREGLLRDESPLSMIGAGLADVLVEVSPTNLVDAQPALDICRAALEQGMHLVLANKGPVCLEPAALESLARQRGRQLRYEATVMAGTPVISLSRETLGGSGVRAARGILNGTCNYMLTQMESGMSYADALAQAQALGYAETDPRADVEGHDAASKAVILAWALFGHSLRLDDLDIEGISRLDRADVDEARAAGERWKLIATVDEAGARVAPQRLPLDHPLASVSGVSNALTWTTENLQDVTVLGPGAGAEATGQGLLADLLAIHRHHQASP